MTATLIHQVRGKCIGVQTIGGPLVFKVPIQDIKPESAAFGGIWFRLAPKVSEAGFVIGQTYDLLVVIHGKPKEYEVLSRIDSIIADRYD